MNFVHDHGLRSRQRFAAGFAGEQNVERLGRGDQNVRRLAPHAIPIGLGRVSRAYQRADLDLGEAERDQLVADAAQRLFEILMNVVR